MGHWHRLSGLLTVSVALVFAGQGCSSDDLPRQPVSGFVTLDGQPLPRGVISFYPDLLEDPNFPVMAGAQIKGGKFSIPRLHGLIPGHYEVAIYSGPADERRQENRIKPGNHPEAAVERIPAKYNSKSHLAIDIKEAAIKEITFNLVSN